ncbi:MAG: hypothetical protein IPL41_13695 [Micropruina sp.]|nr:hypothetical protein [Micropruina sp.]
MNDKYHDQLIESATRALTTDEQGLTGALPTELRNAFALVTTHDRIGHSAEALSEAFGQLRVARASSPMARVEQRQRLPYLLNLVAYLASLPHGWTRDALTAIGAAAAARSTIESRAQIVVAERALRLGVGAVTQQIVAAA